MLISYSPLTFIGTENNLIEISSEQNVNSNGISVINAQKKSLLENIIFKNLGSNEASNWELTGAITFYQSPVEISKCSFENANAEDSLNIIRSEFKIINSNFKNLNQTLLILISQMVKLIMLKFQFRK